MQPQGNGRTRSDNDLAPARPEHRAPDTFQPAEQPRGRHDSGQRESGQHEAVQYDPTDPTPGYDSAPAFDPAQSDPRRSQRLPRPGGPGGRAARRAANGQQGVSAASSQRIPGQGRQAQPPVTQPPMTQVPAPHGRADAPRRGQPRASQPPADRLPPTPGPTTGRRPVSAAWDRQSEVQTAAGPDALRADSLRMERARQHGTGSMPVPGTPAPGAPAARATGAAPTSAQRNGRQQGTGRVARSRPGAQSPGRAVPPASTQEPAIANRLGPATDNGAGGQMGPGSRQGMTPVGQPSRPGLAPVGRLAATALAVPVKAPHAPGSPVTDTSTAVTAITPAIPAERERQDAQRPDAPRPEQRPAADAPAGPERREDIDPTCLTSEMEPISDAVVQKRTIDATLARFSAVHDEMAVEEAQRRSRRMKIMPWLGKDQDLEEALTKNGPVSPATANEPQRPVEVADEDDQDAGRPRIPRKNLPAALVPTRRGRSLISGKVAACGAAVLVLIACFFGWRAVHNVASGSGIQEVAALDENSPAILESQKQYGDSNFLMVGTGTRPGAAATADLTTDTIMVVHIPVDGSRVAVVSFPPNLQVNRPACQQWNNQTNQVSGQVPAQTGVKLSSVYGIGGPRCVTDTVQQLTGLRINHFVGVDTSGFADLVGAVQGVRLCVKQPLRDTALGTIVSQSGQVSLSGTQALNFVRADQITGDKQIADLGRINRQQRFLAALLRKTIGEQNLLMDTGKLNNFLGTFTRSTFGDNMGVDQLVKLATSMQGLALGRITFVTLPTTGTLNAAGEETIDTAASKQLFGGIIDNSALPGETSGAVTNGTAQQQVSPSGIKVQVINAIGDTAAGWAAQTAHDLTPFGYVINQIGGPPPPNVTHTIIKYAAAQQGEAATLASSVPSATLQVDPTMGGAIQLILGPGFDRKVQAPHGTGAHVAGASSTPAGLSYVNATDQSCS
jgi:LCP family protein required for cell wall assembly